jgi:hypothetical protein
LWPARSAADQRNEDPYAQTTSERRRPLVTGVTWCARTKERTSRCSRTRAGQRISAVKLQFAAAVVVGIGELDGERQFSRGRVADADVDVPAEILSRAVAGELQGLGEADELEPVRRVICANAMASRWKSHWASAAGSIHAMSLTR